MNAKVYKISGVTCIYKFVKVNQIYKFKLN